MDSIDKISEDSAGVDLESETIGPSSTCDSEIKPQKDFLVHKVSKFDTLASLAVKYGTTVFDIKRANGLLSDNAMYAKESLIIPLNNQPYDQSKSDYGCGMSSSSSSKKPYRGLKYTTAAPSWNSLACLDDSEQKSVSEIELEMMDEDRIVHERRQELLKLQHYYQANKSRQAEACRPLMGNLHRPPAPSTTTSISEYVASMATSFIKTTEQLFSSPATSQYSALPSTESLLDKIKRVARQSYGDNAGGRVSGMGTNQSQKDLTKLD